TSSPPTPVFTTLSLHDALPIWMRAHAAALRAHGPDGENGRKFTGSAAAWLLIRVRVGPESGGRTMPRIHHALVALVATTLTTPRSEEQRLNSSHVKISYAVFCL